MSSNYKAERDAFGDDKDACDAWEEDLRTYVIQSKIEKDIQTTSGAKLARFMVKEKKLLQSEMEYMARHDVHAVMILVTG
jgi:hypothetical protein